MPRQGLNRDIILREAAKCINEQGYQKLSLALLSSRLDVKPPAMFKHYHNLDELKESLALYGLKMLKQHLQDSVTAKSGEPALIALCHAYRNFAKTNRGIYQAIRPSYFGKNKEIEQAAHQVMSIIISVLKGFEISEENYIHLLRVIRSSLHGFIVLELEFGFGMPASINVSFEHQINAILIMIKDFEGKS